MRETLAALGSAPRAFRLFWRAAPGYTAAQLGISTAHGLQSLVEGWLGKLLVDAIALAVMAGADPRAALPPVAGILAVRGVVALFTACLWPPVDLPRQLGDLLTREVHRLIFRKVNGFRGIALFERPSFYDALVKAESQALNRPASMAEHFEAGLRDALRLATMLGVVVAFSPALAVVLLLLSVPNLYALFRQTRERYSMMSWAVPEARKMQYLRRLLTEKDDAKEIRLFGLGEYFVRDHDATFRGYQRRFEAMRRRHWWSSTLISLLTAVGTAAPLAYVTLEALRGEITLGDLFFLTAAISQVQQSLSSLGWQSAGFYEDSLYVRHLFEFLDLEEDGGRAKEAGERQAGNGERAGEPARPLEQEKVVPGSMREGIALRDVGFSYEPGGREVLKGVSLTIRPGQSVALVGENGAGKSTLVKLLGRLHDPTSGCITVDGTDLRDLDVEAWRRQISVVFQSCAKYNLPARENVGLGNLPFLQDLEAVQEAARRGGADGLIERLPEGYETMLGRRFRGVNLDGVDLSGGEWQKVALARGFMRAPAETEGLPSDDGSTSGEAADEGGAQLLILDEPTAALDARAEHDLFERFRELTRGKATLLISHRFSTVRMADEIAVLEEGRITERGSHEALMARGGTYARLYAMQAERYA